METTTAAPAATLPFAPDQFRGIIVKTEELPDDGAFPEALRAALEAWTSEGFRLVWLDVPLERAAIVPVLAKEGFFFHHANEGTS